jgi:hypothetical protein
MNIYYPRQKHYKQGGNTMRGLFILALFSILVVTNGISQEFEDLKIEEMVFCSGLDERQPVGIDTVFADSVGQVYCFTKIAGATDTTSISHAWYYQEEEKAIVSLAVKAKLWRTWSSKQIVKEWDGKWRVDVLSSEGEILKSKEFLIESTFK